MGECEAGGLGGRGHARADVLRTVGGGVAQGIAQLDGEIARHAGGALCKAVPPELGLVGVGCGGVDGEGEGRSADGVAVEREMSPVTTGQRHTGRGDKLDLGATCHLLDLGVHLGDALEVHLHTLGALFTGVAVLVAQQDPDRERHVGDAASHPLAVCNRVRGARLVGQHDEREGRAGDRSTMQADGQFDRAGL